MKVLPNWAASGGGTLKKTVESAGSEDQPVMTPQTVSLAGAAAVDPSHPFAGLSPDDIASYQQTHDALAAHLAANMNTNYAEMYQPLIDQASAVSVPKGPSPLKSFFATLGSPDQAPALLNKQQDIATSATQQKQAHVQSLKEAILHATIQEQMQKGQLKQAMESTLELDKLHREQDLKDQVSAHKRKLEEIKATNEGKVTVAGIAADAAMNRLRTALDARKISAAQQSKILPLLMASFNKFASQRDDYSQAPVYSTAEAIQKALEGLDALVPAANAVSGDSTKTVPSATPKSKLAEAIERNTKKP